MGDKDELRQQMKYKLNQLANTDEKKGIENKLLCCLMKSSFWYEAEVIGVTLSQSNEWETSAIIKRAWLEGKVVCVPKCHPQNAKMTFYQLTTFSDVELGYANIYEPKVDRAEEMEKVNIDLMIVPGLLFDKQGYRIGYGGGYYDRYLNGFIGKTVSLAHTSQLVNKIPRDSFDLPVNAIVTEKGLIFCEN